MLFFIPCTHFSLSNWATPTFFSSSFYPPSSFSTSTSSLELKNPESVAPAPPLWFFKRRWVVGIVVSGAFGAYSESTDCSQGWIQRLFSINNPPSPLAPLTAQPCPLATLALFVFSHGLLSQPQVSLIINDPEGGGPLVALKVLDLAA